MPSSLCLSATSTSTSSSTYASALKSTGSTLLSQSSPSVSRTLSPTPLSRASSFLPRPYLTIHDLYMRFAPLKSLTSTTSTMSFQVSLPKVLPPMTLKDLFNRFAPKASAIPLNPPAIAKSPPAPQSKTLPVPPAPQPSSLQARHEREPSAKPYTNPVEQQRSNISKFDPNGVFQSLWEKYRLDKETGRSKPFFELSGTSIEAHTNRAYNS